MVNATQHFWNLDVMRAAAAAGVHYTDMGGLFHVTRQQVELHEEFRRAGVTAVISMGGAPGVTNLLAAYGAARLDTIEEAHAYCGNVDHTDWSGYDGWFAPYSLETLCDEFSVVAPQFIDGEWVTASPAGRGPRPSISGRPPECCPPTTRSTPSPSLSGTPGRTAGCAAPRGSSRCPEFNGQMRLLTALGLTGTEEVELPGGAGAAPRRAPRVREPDSATARTWSWTTSTTSWPWSAG